MNYRSMDKKDIQSYGYDLLCLFDRICAENHLTYFLSGGTLLGAIRHKGFIPWDDDVDVMMPRADFMKLQDVIGKYTSERYGYGSVYTDPEYMRPWARLWDTNTRMLNPSRFTDQTPHVFIDIFPIDGIPAGKTATKLFFRMMRVYDAACKMSKRKHIYMDERLRVFKLAIYPFCLKVGGNRWARKMHDLAMKYPFGKTQFAGVSMTIKYGSREKLPAEVFASSVDVDFCGRKFPAPVGWESYLKALYRDYMKLPPEDQRDEHMFEFLALTDEHGNPIR